MKKIILNLLGFLVLCFSFCVFVFIIANQDLHAGSLTDADTAAIGIENVMKDPGGELGVSPFWVCESGATATKYTTLKRTGKASIKVSSTTPGAKCYTSFTSKSDNNEVSGWYDTTSTNAEIHVSDGSGATLSNPFTPPAPSSHTFMSELKSTLLTFIGKGSGRLYVIPDKSSTNSVVLDDVYIGANRNVGTQQQMTDWIPYTPTVTGHGTISSVDVLYRVVGQALEIIGTYTSGTVSATAHSISLPSGYVANIATGKLVGRITWNVSPSAVNNEVGICVNTNDKSIMFACNEGVGGSLNNLVPVNGDTSGSSFVHGFRALIPISNGLQSTVTVGSESATWSGSLDQDCTWSRSSATFGDPSTDTSCTLITRKGSGLTGVTVYGGANTLPGITWTPLSTERYLVSSRVAVSSSASAQHVYGRMVDQNGDVVCYADNVVTNSGARPIDLHCNGLVDGSPGIPASFRWQFKGAGDTIDIASAIPVVDFTVTKITQSVPQPIITNSVSTGGTSNNARAHFGQLHFDGGAWSTGCTSSPCRVVESTDTGVSVTRVSSGVYDLNVPSGVCSGKIIAVPVVIDQATSGECLAAIAEPSATVARINCVGPGGVGASDNRANVHWSCLK